MNKLADLVVRFPWVFIIFFLAITGVFGSQLPKTEVDPAVKSQLPPDLPTRANLDKLEEMFGGSDMVMVSISSDDVLNPDTLLRVKKISKKMERVKDFDKVISLFTLKDIQGEDGQMIVDPAVKRIPKTDKAREKLRADLKDNDMIYGNVLSKDFKHTAVIGFLGLKATDEVVLEKINRILEEYPGPESVLIAGMPFTRSHLSKDIKGDMQRFMPYGLLIMLIFLYVCFRQLRGVLLPFIMTVMAIVVAMGLIPILGWKIQMITIIVPVILIAVANDYGIHLMSRYQEDNLPGAGLDSKGLAKKGIQALGAPILFTAVTTIAGLMSLLTHVIIPAQQLGILASAGVAFALVGSLLFIPSVLAVLPMAKPVLDDLDKRNTRISFLDRILRKTAAEVSRRPKAILAAVIGIVLAAIPGIWLVVVDTNPNNYYPADAPVRVSGDLVSEYFGGSTSTNVMIQGDIKSPEIMKEIDAFEKHMETHPNVDITTSIAKVVREMNEVMHDGDKAMDRIPGKRDTIAQYFLLYSMSGEPDDFDRLVDFPYKHAQVTARINENGTQIMKDVIRYAHDYIATRPEGVFVMVSGFADMFSDLVDHVVHGQVYSLLLSLVLVGVLVGVLFRSFFAGVLTVVPLALSMVLLFGLMGYFDIELNIATSMLSSIMIGVGVDYTIHYLWRYREERRNGLDPMEAVRVTLSTTGRGIVFNALSVVVGFSVLMLSAFLPVKFFGILVVISISACMVGALVLLPVISILFRPRFLEPNAK